MDAAALQAIAEAVLRVTLGYRFLSSGLSNAQRWPHATETAAIISKRWAGPLGLAATVFMVAGGAGLILGLATPLAALLLIAFLLPTFVVHRHWLAILPPHVAPITAVITGEEARSTFRLLTRHAVHAHETGLLENAVYLAACLYFLARGAPELSVDAWLRSR